jgi:DNA-directed RNA polymerase specialized sigma24 family protein
MGTHRNSRARRTASAGFARLLARFDPNPDRAAAEYERLRITLERFFDWRGAWPPDECADETLDRLARKLEATIVEDVRHYAHGIARLVLLERRRGPTMTSIEGHPDVITVPPTVAAEDDRLHECLDHCLSQFPEDSRSRLFRYYEGDGLARIESRRRLAVALGVSDNALRSRVQRLRDRLELCVQACVSQRGEHRP